MSLAFSRLLLFVCLACSGPAVLAQQPDWRDLPPEERRAMRKQMRDHWQQGSEASSSAPSSEPGRRWQDLPADERRRLRHEMRERHQASLRKPEPAGLWLPSNGGN